MVYPGMWECLECHYVNDDWEESCQRCGLGKISPSLTAPPSAGEPAQVQPAEPVPASGEAMPVRVRRTLAESRAAEGAATGRRRRMTLLETAGLLLVLISLGGCLAVGYLAWRQGVLDHYLPEQLRSQGPGTAGQQSEGGALTEAELLGDPLSDLETTRTSGFASFRRFIQPLRKAREELADVSFSSTAPATLSAESIVELDSLGGLGDQLLEHYSEFEPLAAKARGEELLRQVDVLRSEFAARFTELITALGQAYSRDGAATHTAYLLSDTIPNAVEQLGKIDPLPLREAWRKAVHAREQMFLDIKNDDVYRQLEARYSALVEVHNSANAALKSVPPVEWHGGVLSEDGAKLLDLYDGLATHVEKLVVEFEAYSATLTVELDSDRRRGLIKQFLDLAQGDHLLCFEEVYKIYARDRELSHPAYENLRVHYDFVKAHWPGRRSSYEEIFNRYEEEWQQRWGQT